MPKSVSKEVVDDSEEEQPKRTSRKSSKPDSPMDVDEISDNNDKKDDETNEGEGEDNGEDENAEEEFEIESIQAAKPGVFDEGKVGYLVRWKGYGPEHDSWVTESDAENAKDLIKEFWAKKKKGSREKLEAKTMKGKAGRPRKSDSDVVERLSSPTQKRKRGRGTRTSTRNSALKESEDEAEEEVNDEEEEEEPSKPAKKSRTSSSKTPAKKPKRENGTGKSSQQETPDPDVEENLPVAEYRPADQELFAKDSWERLVKNIDTIEQMDGSLKVFFTLNNGDRVFAENKQCRRLFPQKMLTFYENNLRWREVDS